MMLGQHQTPNFFHGGGSHHSQRWIYSILIVSTLLRVSNPVLLTDFQKPSHDSWISTSASTYSNPEGLCKRSARKSGPMRAYIALIYIHDPTNEP